jgi:septal ring factor EnvC (AmiA/AmiB activator)
MRSGLLFFCLFAGLAAANQSVESQTTIKEQELEDVRQRINALKQSMDKSAKERDRLTASLQDAEISIAEIRQRLSDLEREQRFSERRRDELAGEIRSADAKLAAQTEELGNQVRAAYMGGNQGRVKLLLNQQDPATLGRLSVYYDYLNNYRAGNIEAINTSLARLSELRIDAATEAARLQDLATERYAELTRLNASQDERRRLLASINERMDTEAEEIERLAAQERDLTRLITELTEILSDYPIRSEQPFASYKGKLTWPVAGSLVHDFGQPRAGGQLTWNGVVLMAPKGREVRAVYHGRVIFADWLAGMGLIIIVDHGDSYLSLYGYNETLQKESGDWVAPGDVIATVGDSGGQPQASLYFEIRRGATSLNPQQWFSRRPGD